jgi:hypothetical protein
VLLTLALIGCGSHHQGQAIRHHATPAARHTKPAPERAHPAAVRIPSGTGSLAVMAPSRGLTLRARPNGKVIAHLRPQTYWDSPTVVWAVARRGPWLGVIATPLHNNQIGWLNVRHDRPHMWRERLSLYASLSQKILELRRGRRVLDRIDVGIGSPSTPTPTGRFTVTDKLTPDASQPYYGCCLLALSGHQPHLRPGWAGGDRIAIHGGSGIGAAASAGCLHATDADLKRLMKIVPIGTPVVIRA